MWSQWNRAPLPSNDSPEISCRARSLYLDCHVVRIGDLVYLYVNLY
jgi:hypothetical protein